MSQLMHNLTKEHVEAVNRILRYLKMTPGKELLYKEDDTRVVEVFLYANWAGDVIDKHSKSKYCSYTWGNLVT